ncbi:peptidyl-prolyl cis-trans isomerase D [Franzmannia pantelleriensis]|uniref:Periplasmic chaperone PpiD n=1 Tax=Franzmannia pantelleriensis TaxID=48727 RepID=A0A1G9MJA9_9GAMM|nr:SurA N-terminal domain-containing protein [Halomonas pantelleriensis]SDL74091.1 peptidyl-prolyl cis-trans isomerase D [Halomonas pantelleriensis]
MLQSIRDRSKSWGAKIIIGAVVVTMALFGVDSLVTLFTGSPDDVAEVNGQTITRQQVEMNVQRAIRSGQVPPEQERALRNQVLDELITDALLDSYAEDGGLFLSEGQLDQLIVTLPEFQDQNGRFDADLFRNRLASAGYSPTSFREELKADMQRQQLQQGLAFSDFTLESERERLGELQRQTRSFRYHLLEVGDLETPPEASEEQLEAYYEVNADNYQRPEQVRLEYVIIDRDEMAAEYELDEQALRDAYAERGSDAERRVSHIMVTFNGERSREEAEARLEEVQARLDEGDDFAELAEEYSDDTSTSGAGGDLGTVSRGFFDDAFENAAFSLGEGDTSDIVESGNGLHLIRVTELDMPSFEAIRDDLQREAALSEVTDDFNRRVQQLIDDSFAADDLQSVADDIGLELQTTDWVSRDAAEGVLSEPGVMEAAFSDDVLVEGFNSEVLELDDDRRMVLRVADHRDATLLELDEVRERVEASVMANLRREALRDLAASQIEALRDGDELDIDWQAVESVDRQSGAAPQAVIRAAFRLPRPEDGARYGHVVDGDRVAIIALDSVASGEVDAEVEGFVTQMAERLRAQAAIQGLLEYLRSTAEIERL